MRLEDVAKKAKVSPATVSRVVNGIEVVRPSTRKRVLVALEELNYTPNLQARSLVSGQTKTLGIIVSNLENPFFVELFHLLESHALRQGYEVLLANTNYESERLGKTIRLMLGRRVAGLAVAVSEKLPPEIYDVRRAQIPVVCFGSGQFLQDIAIIRLDEYKGMRKLVSYLYSLGHRRMAYIGYRLSLGTTEERRTAFLETAKELEIEHTYFTVHERDGFETGRDAVRDLMRSGFDASAILCLNDITAVGALRELHNRNIRVPEDVSVSGFDNISLAEFCYPALTSVHIPCDQVARMMFKMLSDEQTSGKIRTEYLVDPEVIVRESTGPHLGSGLLSKNTKGKNR